MTAARQRRWTGARSLPRRALVLLVLVTAALFASIVAVWGATGTFVYEFLAVNLGLAWIPVLLAGLLTAPYVRGRLIALPLCLTWLVFLPNAPYLVTDLVHVGEHGARVPLWIDVAVLLLAALCGMLAWAVSTRLVELALRARFGLRTARVAATLAGVLAGVGICVGRVLRWNSWDVVARPADLVGDVLTAVADPIAHARGLTLMLAVGGLLGALALAQSLLGDVGSLDRGVRIGRYNQRSGRKR